MTLKEKFNSIDQSRITADQKAFLDKMKNVTKDFTLENKEVNDKVEGALDKMIASFKDKMPDAIKTTKKVVVPATEKTKKTTKVVSKTTTPKRTVMSLAKEIRKDGESWKDAQKRAGDIIKEDKADVSEVVKKELDRINKFINSRAELKGISGTNIKRDAVRTAKPRGVRTVTKSGETSNQYGTFSNKLGRRYWESRDRHADRLAPNYPKDAPLLAEGGYLTDPNFGNFQNQVFADGGFMNNVYADGGGVEDVSKSLSVSKLYDQDGNLMGYTIKDKYNVKGKYTLSNTKEKAEEILQYLIDNPSRLAYYRKNEYANGGFMDGYYDKGGSIESLTKELYRLQRELNSSRLQTYRLGDNSQEAKDRKKEREVKLARFNEVLKELRESDAKFELGGVMATDLAGHTGGALGTGDPTMLDGFSNTGYTGLVGETGAMSSGEMFENGGGLPSGVSQAYMITESFGNPAQHYSLGGGVDNDLVYFTIDNENLDILLNENFKTHVDYEELDNGDVLYKMSRMQFERFEDLASSTSGEYEDAIQEVNSDGTYQMMNGDGVEEEVQYKSKRFELGGDLEFSDVKKYYNENWQDLKSKGYSPLQILDYKYQVKGIKKYLDSGEIVISKNPSGHYVSWAKNSFELGGAFMMTDLAGHTGGGTGGLNAGMPLDGFSNTGYTGLVGETGAMSSGEMFVNGGGVGKKLNAGVYRVGKPIKVGKMYEQKVAIISDNGQVRSNSEFGSTKTDFISMKNPMITEKQFYSLNSYADGGSYEAGGGLPSGVSQAYMITESFGNPAQHYVKGGGIPSKYEIDRFKQVMNGKVIAKYVVRLNASFGNKETYVFGIRLRDQFKGCVLSPYEVLYGGWEDGGTPFSLSNLQVKELVPNTYTKIELDEEETVDLVTKLIKQDKASVEKFLNTNFFYLTRGNFDNILQQHFQKSVSKYVSSEFSITTKFDKGGKIENQYEGRTPEDVWNNWALPQKLHFLSDHTEEVYGKASVKGETNNDINEFFANLIYEKYDNLPINTKVALVMHTTRGQYKGGGMLDAKERYVLEIKGLTGLRKEAIENYIAENNLSDNDVLNIVIGLGRKQLKGTDVASAVVGKKGNTLSKKVIQFAKDNKGMKLEEGGKIDAFTLRLVKGTGGNPDEAMTEPRSVQFGEGGGVSQKEKREDYLEKLMNQESRVWDKIGANSGGEIRQDKTLLRKYAEGVQSVMEKEGVGYGSFDQEDYEYFEDQNYHLLNDFLVWNNYFEPTMTKDEKSWRQKMYDDDVRQKGKSTYTTNPEIITISSTTSKSKSDKDYIVNADIVSVIVKKGGKEVTYSGKDVLNGANVLAEGGGIEDKAFYFSKNNVVSVELKNGKTIKPANGYWVDKDATPIKKMDTGGEVDRFSEYSNDALADMIINLSRYENTESEIQMVKDELKKRKANKKMNTGGGVEDNEVKFITYKDEEIMYEPTYSEYFVNDEQFMSLKEAKNYIDKGSPMSNKTINAYRKGAFSNGGVVFEKGEEVIYLGKPAIIKGINTDMFGKKSYKVAYDSGNGTTVADYIYNKGNEIVRKNKYDNGGRFSKRFGINLPKFKWEEAEIGDSARVKEINRMGLIVKIYGRKFHLKFPNGTEKTFDASSLEFFKSGENEYYEGGKFEKLSDKVAKNYEGKRVKPQYQKEYGKVYSKDEAKEVGDKVAGKVKASQKMNTGGETKKGARGGIMTLAKQIRKDGEKWTDAVKRAGKQLK